MFQFQLIFVSVTNVCFEYDSHFKKTKQFLSSHAQCFIFVQIPVIISGHPSNFFPCASIRSVTARRNFSSAPATSTLTILKKQFNSYENVINSFCLVFMQGNLSHLKILQMAWQEVIITDIDYDSVTFLATYKYPTLY